MCCASRNVMFLPSTTAKVMFSPPQKGGENDVSRGEPLPPCGRKVTVIVPRSRGWKHPCELTAPANAALTEKPRVVPLPLTAPARVIRRAEASAESPFSPRRRIYIRREGESGDRKTNYNQKEKPVRGSRTGFNLKWRFTMRRVFTERNALTDNNNHPIRFSVCACIRASSLCP